MNRIRRILDLDHRAANDEGFTLVEVIVAMMVFAVISITVALSIGNALVITHDSRSRTTAINLASQDLDLARAVTDVFAVTSKTWTTTVQGTTYTIARAVEWAGSSTTATACGAGDGTLQYKVVTDTVSFPGAGTANPVVSRTVLAPNSRINDPALGTIIVAVSGASGAAEAGVTVTITPSVTNPNGALAVAVPAATDSNGCAYALKVAPGNYTVAITEPGGIGIDEKAISTKTATVTAGNAYPVPFTYDNAATFGLTYASNYTGSVLLPTNLDTTFSSSVSGDTTFQLGLTGSVSLFPFTGGYGYEAGAYVAPIVGTTGAVTNKPCVNVDPGAWTTANAKKVVGKSFATPSALPGDSVKANVPMGVLTLPAFTGTVAFQATAVNTTANGDPGCSSGVTYTFAPAAGSPTIALPFGTWRITTLGLVGITPSAVKTGGVVNSDGTVTLDPRGVTP